MSKQSDLHGRTPEQVTADEWFRKQWQQRYGSDLSGDMLDAKRFSFAKKGHFVEIVRRNVEGEPITTRINIPPYGFDRHVVEKILRAEATGETLDVEKIEQAIAESALQPLVAINGEDHTSQKMLFLVAPTPDGLLKLGVPQQQPLNGTLLNCDGTISNDTMDEETYRAYLPLMQRAPRPGNGFTMDVICAEVAHLVKDTPEMLAKLNAQLAGLPGTSVYMAQPRWLRYYSDGDMSSQRSALHGIRNAPYPVRDGGEYMRPLLYDGPAWVVGLRLGDKLLPGRCFVNSNGDFICSDWCQREVDKGGGIDLYTGANVKHTLMTWVAGPAISRFGPADLKEAHQLRPMRKVNSKAAGGLLSNNDVRTLVKLFTRWVKGEGIDDEDGHHPQLSGHTDATGTGIGSVRVSARYADYEDEEGDSCWFVQEMSIFAGFKDVNLEPWSVTLNILFNKEEKPVLSSIYLEVLKSLGTHELAQANHNSVRKILDKDTAKAVYKALYAIAHKSHGNNFGKYVKLTTPKAAPGVEVAF